MINMNKRSIAIIPARGGSKRIPKKNIKLFNGKPIIAYSIEAACKAKLFHRIIVSTDSEKIAEVAEKYGAEVPFLRPPELADDHTGTEAVILHALNWLIDRRQAIDHFCCIYATAPFILPEYIRKGFELLQETKAVSAFCVCRYPAPIFRALKINDAHRLEMIWPKYLEVRSQDLPESYQDAGQFYWAETRRYLEEEKLYSSDAVPIILPWYQVVDIDTIEDWKMAELMFRVLSMSKGREG